MAKPGRAKPLLEADFQALERVVSSNRYPSRDRVAISLGRRSALRVGTVAALRWQDVLTADGTEVADHVELPKFIVKKADAGRSMPLHPETKKLLAELRERFPDRCRPELPVIFSEDGNGFSANSLSRVFLRWCAKAKLTGVSFHSLRRTRITEWARTCQTYGGSLRDAQILAGHRDLTSTETYIEGNSDAQKAMMMA